MLSYDGVPMINFIYLNVLVYLLQRLAHFLIEEFIFKF